MKKRIVLTEKEHAALLEAHDWCAREGLTGLRDYYREHLVFLASRGALPGDQRPEEEEGEDR